MRKSVELLSVTVNSAKAPEYLSAAKRNLLFKVRTLRKSPLGKRLEILSMSFYGSWFIMVGVYDRRYELR